MTEEQIKALEDAMWDYLNTVKTREIKPSIYMENLLKAFPDIAKRVKKKVTSCSNR